MAVEDYLYDLDVTGLLAANKIVNELHTIEPPIDEMPVFVVPAAAPFFEGGAPSSIFPITVTHNNQPLIKGVDYFLTHRFVEASAKLGKPIFGSISFFNRNLSGQIKISYQTLGGVYTLNNSALVESLTQELYNVRTVTWDQVLGVPALLPPLDHNQNVEDMLGWDDLIEAAEALTEVVGEHLANPPPLNEVLDTFATYKDPFPLSTTFPEARGTFAAGNLNGLVAPGVYRCPLTSIATLVRNYPLAGATGYLFVKRDRVDPLNPTAGMVVQHYEVIVDPILEANEDPYLGHSQYVRRWTRVSDTDGVTWTAWVKDDIETAVLQAMSASSTPVGTVSSFARKTAPLGWAPLNGVNGYNINSSETFGVGNAFFNLFEMFWDDFDDTEFGTGTANEVTTINTAITVNRGRGFYTIGDVGGGVQDRIYILRSAYATAQLAWDAGVYFCLWSDGGYFSRGWSATNTVDAVPARKILSIQQDEFKEHSHELNEDADYGTINNADDDPVNYLSGQEESNPIENANPALNAQEYISNAGGLETRPKNRAYLMCIKL